MLEIRNQEHWDKVWRKAKERGVDRKQLAQRLAYLDTYANGPGCTYERDGSKCVLGHDFADLSFSFAMYHGDGKGGWVYWFNGGLIYHGDGEWGVHT